MFGSLGKASIFKYQVELKRVQNFKSDFSNNDQKMQPNRQVNGAFQRRAGSGQVVFPGLRSRALRVSCRPTSVVLSP